MQKSLILILLFLTLFSVIEAQTVHSMQERFYHAVALAEKGLFDEAIVELNKVIEFDPKSFGAYYLRGSTRFAKQDVDGALSDFNKAIQFAPPMIPNLDRVYNSRGITRELKKDAAGALSDFNKALSLNPKYAEAYSNRAANYLRAKKYDAAMPDLEKAIEIKPNLIAAHIGLGDVWFARRNFDKAIVAFSKALDLDKDIAAAYLLRGVSYGLLEELALALPDLRKSVELNANRATIFQGGIEFSLRDFDIFIEENPLNATGHQLRGIVRLLQGKDAEAETDFKKAVEIDKNLEIEIKKLTAEIKGKTKDNN
jgi:tetratricopeptide (TPR) repeat protein